MKRISDLSAEEIRNLLEELNASRGGYSMNTPSQLPAATHGPGLSHSHSGYSVQSCNSKQTVTQYSIPAKGIAIVQPTMKEGSRTFFRDTPIIGPT